MASYTRTLNRYSGGDPLWTDQSNASTIIIADFFGVIEVYATAYVSNLTIQSNSVVAKGNSNAIVSNSSLVVNANSITAIGNAVVNTSGSSISFESKNITAIGGANAFVTQLNALLSVNGISAKGDGLLSVSALNISFNLVDSNPTGALSLDAVANVSNVNIEINSNNVTAYEVNTNNNEIVLLNSYITNKLKWEKSIKVKLILQSKLR